MNFLSVEESVDFAECKIEAMEFVSEHFDTLALIERNKLPEYAQKNYDEAKQFLTEILARRFLDHRRLGKFNFISKTVHDRNRSKSKPSA